MAKGIIVAISVASFISLVVFPASLFFVLADTGEHLVVHFLDVGQGDATLIRFPDRTTMLIDGGIDNRVLYQLGALLPFWEHDIDYLVATHPDLDHYGGLLGVVEKYQVDELWYADQGTSSLYGLLFDMAQERGVVLRQFSQGDVVKFQGDVVMEFLWPPADYKSEDKNARSLAALLKWKEVSVLLMGDLPGEEELMVTSQYGDIAADVLKVGHHGSNTSSEPAFLAAVSPKICAISAGADNSFGHPHEDVIERLEKAHCAILTTADYGTYSARTDGHDIQLHFSRP